MRCYASRTLLPSMNHWRAIAFWAAYSITPKNWIRLGLPGKDDEWNHLQEAAGCLT